MKIEKTVSLCVLVVVLLAGACFEHSRANATAEETSASSVEEKCLRIGIVSVRKIFQQCRRTIKHRRQSLAEQDKVQAELDKLSKEVDLDKAGLKTLKAGSDDYSALMKELFDKQAKFQARQEYFKQQMQLKEQGAIEKLFNDLLTATAQVAKEKGLDMVLERSEPEFPAANNNDLTLTISTHKVLYSAGCEDITDAVMARLDAAE